MEDRQSLSHTVWECKYHVVWIPKYRRKRIFGELRQYLGDVFRELARQKRARYWKDTYCQTMSICWWRSPRSMRCPRSSATSRGRAPFTSPGIFPAAVRILWDNPFGPEATMSPRRAGMKTRCASIYESKRPRTDGSINWRCLADTFRWL